MNAIQLSITDRSVLHFLPNTSLAPVGTVHDGVTRTTWTAKEMTVADDERDATVSHEGEKHQPDSSGGSGTDTGGGACSHGLWTAGKTCMGWNTGAFLGHIIIIVPVIKKTHLAKLTRVHARVRFLIVPLCFDLASTVCTMTPFTCLIFCICSNKLRNKRPSSNWSYEVLKLVSVQLFCPSVCCVTCTSMFHSQMR